VALDKPPRDIEFASDGSALYVTVAGESAVLVLDPQSNRFVARVATGPSPHIASWFAGAAAATAVVQGTNELLLFDPKSYAVLGAVAVGKQPHWMAADAQGATVYVTNEGSNDLSIIDLAARQARSVPVGSAPRKVVVPRARAAATTGSAVSIKDFAFGPRELVIAAGQTVTWRNDDGAPHSLAFKDGASGADLLLPGQQFSRHFDAPGSIDYICSVHPYMAGKVVVRGPSTALTTKP
jgi:YVTN family beta-propeller protein